MTKTLDITDIKGAKANINDIKVFGNGDLFKLLSKASSDSQGWMKSTKGMEIPGKGVVVQVTTQQRNQARTRFWSFLPKLFMGSKYKPTVTYSLAEAVTFVPGVRIVKDSNNGSRLEPVEIENALEKITKIVKAEVAKLEPVKKAPAAKKPAAKKATTK